MDLMIVVPSHANGLVMEPGAEQVRWCSPGTCLAVFHMSIAKDHVSSSAMVLACQSVGKEAIRVVTIPVIIVAGIVISHRDHFARRHYGAVRNTLSLANCSAKYE